MTTVFNTIITTDWPSLQSRGPDIDIRNLQDLRPTEWLQTISSMYLPYPLALASPSTNWRPGT